MAVRVQEHEVRWFLSAALYSPAEMMEMPSALFGECLAADDTLPVLL